VVNLLLKKQFLLYYKIFNFSETGLGNKHSFFFLNKYEAPLCLVNKLDFKNTLPLAGLERLQRDFKSTYPVMPLATSTWEPAIDLMSMTFFRVVSGYLMNTPAAGEERASHVAGQSRTPRRLKLEVESERHENTIASHP
jgi:hypothetical protein